MSIVFTIRMDKDLYENLSRLAYITHRSKVGFVRWLISESSREFLDSGAFDTPASPKAILKDDLSSPATSTK